MTKDLNVWVLTHNKKVLDISIDDKHTPLQVGADACGNIDVCELKDNIGDNISFKNSIYCELTGHYWIWKNALDSKYVGIEHYRRHFNINNDEIVSILENNDIILPNPIVRNDMTVQDFYKQYHIASDIDLCEEIVKELYPEYSNSWDKYIKNGHELFYANSFITKKEYYSDLCDFIFTILSEFEKRNKLITVDDWKQHIENKGQYLCPPDHLRNGVNWKDYQLRIGGFLSERLITLYVLHNFSKRVCVDFVDLEVEYRKNDMKVLLCCIGRQENDYIREYVDYYKLLGVDNICLYDNNRDGEEDFRDVIGDEIDNGFVILKNYRNRTICQLDAYNECYREFGNQYDWIMFFDLDEYMFINSDPDIKAYLSSRDFDLFNVIQLNWVCVGDCDQLYNDGRNIKERLNTHLDLNLTTIYSFPDNFHTKAIIRGGLNNVSWDLSPHLPNVPGPHCNGSGILSKEKQIFIPYDYRRAGLLHFTTKTADEYAKKVKRGFPDGNPTSALKMVEIFFKRNKITQEKIDIFNKELGIDVSYLLPKKFNGVKSDKIKIYSLCYDKKNFQFKDDAVITPLQVGASNGKNVCELKDNIGDNISDKNYFYIENTGTYWIWKNVNGAKYKGQMQYRRPLEGIDENTNFDDIFNNYDVITCEPFHHPSHKVPTPEQPMIISADTVEQGYAFSNCIDDLYVLEMAVKMTMPEYKESWDKYIKNGPNLYYSNGFIMRSEDYDRYCEFLFKCLDAYLKMTKIDSPEKLFERVRYHIEVGKYPRYLGRNITEGDVRWQMSIGGFLSERLLTLWLLHNFKEERIYKLPYVKMEEGMYT